MPSEIAELATQVRSTQRYPRMQSDVCSQAVFPLADSVQPAAASSASASAVRAQLALPANTRNDDIAAMT
jgi:hypothetical protein